MWKAIASNFLTLAILGLVVAVGFLGWAERQYTAAGPLEDAICLQVPPGSNMRRVAASLEDQGAIASGMMFRLGADYSGRADRLKAGSFLIDGGMSMADIVAEITGTGQSSCGTQVRYLVQVAGLEKRVRRLNPDTQEFETVAEFDPSADGETPEAYGAALDDVATEYEIVVTEGVTSWQVVEALKASDLFSGEVSRVPDEGALAPGSFEIRPGQDREAFLASLRDLQSERLATAWAGRPQNVPVETPEEALILASIIEKETAVAEERRQVASVFANRLERGIRLQTDPTVIYGVTGGQGVLGRGLRQSELRRETPYNTYVIEGLPPTPIANPGLASIEAALDPADTDFLFFVADGTGGHAFAETLDEHNRNVAEWRRIEAERANQ